MTSVARLARGAGAVLLAWAALLVAEHLVVSSVYRDYFSGTWELVPARTCALPIALGALVVLAPLVVLLAALRDRSRALAAVGVGFGAAVGFGVTFGRHFASWAVRGPAIAVFAAACGAGLALALPRLLGKRAPALLAIAALAWSMDSWVLPRLYPAFHLGLLAVALVASGLFALERQVGLGKLAWLGLALGIASAAWAPFAAPRLATYGNLRMVLAEHAPVAGRGLIVAAWLSPPPPEDDGVVITPVAEGERALDWTGHDLVLISVDALRADHVGAYGYARPTTPNLDALAKEGTLFEDAYCPTPHTSYSVTSMMTGKYMRPLLTLGLGQDSETWAAQLRRYDYKTAAFYPPAVFFIDTDRFERFRRDSLDFEYKKEEFADPALRAAQLTEYLHNTPVDRPLFLWVHFFEPHEPYVQHPGHGFGDTEKDAYDSEIAAADEGIGQVVALVRARRPGAVVIVTADHGEEFGEHGGRYHGTTVYEEQVRVPLVVVGPSVAAGARVTAPVQTIDLLPTTLSALGIPRPARLRGRDLGPTLAHPDRAGKGLAFAETDDFELYAEGADRLVCDKRAGACALYDVTLDRAELHDTSRTWPDKAKAMRGSLVGIAHAHGKFEGQGGTEVPEALRLGAQGDVGAAPEVAALLDDANVEIRRKAAAVLFALRGKGVVAELARALGREEDAESRKWEALALVRAGEVPSLIAESLLRSADFEDRKLAALAFAERGDKRASIDLVAWLHRLATGEDRSLDLETSRDLVAAAGKLGAPAAIPDLSTMLRAGDGASIRLRPLVADALGAIGDPAATSALVEALAAEAQASSRLHEARALAALGAKGQLADALAPWVASPDPMLEAVGILRDAHALEPRHGGSVGGTGELRVRLHVGTGAPRVVLLVEQAAPTPATIAGITLTPRARSGGVSLFELETPGEDVEIVVPGPVPGALAARAKPLAPDGGLH